MSPRPPLLLLLALLPVTSIFAEGVFSSLSENYFLDDLPLVLTATRLPQAIDEAPAAITVIDQETIRASGAQNIPDVLRLVPGIQVGQVNGSKMTVSYHGFSDRYTHNMQVLIDGRSIYDASYGLVAWTDLPVTLEDIARIEVIRGPNAATYGANAYSATINIITFHPSEQTGTLTKVIAGRPDSKTVIARHAQSFSNSDHRLTLKYDENEGIETRYDDSETRMASYRGDYQLNSQDILLLELGYSRGPRYDGFGSPDHTDYGVFALDPDFDVYQPERRVDDEHYVGQMKWTRTYSADNEISLQFYYSHQQIDDAFYTVSFSDYGTTALSDALLPLFGQTDQRLFLGYGTESDRYDLEFTHRSKPQDDLRLSWGLGARHDLSKSVVVYGTDDAQTRYQFRAFANAEWRASPNLIINGGTMVEKHEDFSTQVSPRLAANIHLTKKQTLRFSITDAYRMPTLVENHSNLYAAFEDGGVFDFVDIGPGNIEPEEMRSYEIGYILNFAEHGFSLDAKIYKDQLRNMIELPKDKRCLEVAISLNNNDVCVNYFDDFAPDYRGAYTYGNYGEADITGFELGAIWHITRQTLLRAAYAYADAENTLFIDINPDVIRTRDDQAPNNTYSLLFAHAFDSGINTSVAYYYMDDMRWVGEGNMIPEYHRLDARIAKSFQFGQTKGNTALVLQNIDNTYLDFQVENEIRNRAYFEFELLFK